MECIFREQMCDVEYIKHRLDDQIEWYSKKSSKYRNFHYTFKISEIILTASIAFFSLLLKDYNIDCLIGIISLFLISITSIHTFCNFQENWIEYRKTSETLKHEKYMYKSISGVYDIKDGKERFKLLTERCETIISHENINWAQLNDKEYKNTK